MPEPGPRAAFLAAVQSRLDLPEAIARDVLEELADHLDDAVTDLRAAGLSADDAERRAIGDFGDGRTLGLKLARARHGRGRLLAGVGGGVRAVLVEGFRTWVFAALVLSLTMLLALPVSSLLLDLLGRSPTSLLAGPVGSLATTGAVVGGFAYLGWILPAQVASPAVRSVLGVRKVVALFGLAVGSFVVWFLLRVALDPILAVGLPLGPVAFALTALRAPERPTFRVGFVPAAIGAAILFVPMTLLALGTATDSTSGNWTADISSIGTVPAATDVESNALGIDWALGAGGSGVVRMDAGPAADLVAARLPTLRVEIWPALVVDGVVQFGSAPLFSQSRPTERITILDYSLPSLRDPIKTAAFLVGIAPDGHRVVLGQNLDFARTPPWTGTLVEWWAGT